MKPFAGFPEGRLRATMLPSLFFSEALGDIDDLAELKVVLYLFWRLGEKRTYPRMLSRADLEADPVVRRGLGENYQSALASALDRLVTRKLVLRRTMEVRGRRDAYYFLNTASGRRSIDDLESRRIDLGQVVEPPEPDERAKRSDVFALYEDNIGLLSPILVDELAEAERRYPGEWIEDAIRQAVLYNRRSWRYVQRILERWAVEGKRGETPRGSAPAGQPSSTQRGGGRT
jgi:DnaD/phage-associated family protein